MLLGNQISESSRFDMLVWIRQIANHHSNSQRFELGQRDSSKKRTCGSTLGYLLKQPVISVAGRDRHPAIVFVMC